MQDLQTLWLGMANETVDEGLERHGGEWIVRQVQQQIAEAATLTDAGETEQTGTRQGVPTHVEPHRFQIGTPAQVANGVGECVAETTVHRQNGYRLQSGKLGQSHHGRQSMLTEGDVTEIQRNARQTQTVPR